LTAGSARYYSPPAVDDMSQETLQVPEEREALAARLAAVERAYAAALERLRLYEREREDIRGRLKRILVRIGFTEPA
jgi:hypothetical protein